MHSNSASALSTVHTAWQNLISGFITTTLGPMWSTHQSATTVVTDQLDMTSGKNQAQLQSALALVGTGAGNTLSPRSCVVIGLRTIVPTRAGRGRMYWPAPDSTHLSTSGQLMAGDATSICTAFQSRLTTFKATSQPVIYHRPIKDAHGVVLTPGTIDNITSVTVGVILGTQRRRTNRVANSYTSSNV
jgi:hypothetical protein